MAAERAIFEGIESESVVDAAAGQIERLIVAGVLQSGRKLPSERELSEQMGISRPKVREAIKLLEDRGLLMVRHGEGTFVAHLTGAALSPAMIELFARHPDAFIGYLEFRREVEGFAAYLAAQRATESDREIIRKIAEEMRIAHEGADPVRELELDIKLHTCIVDATHNPMLVQVMASIYELMRSVVQHGRTLQVDQGISRDRLLEQHLKLADAIVDGDPQAATEAAEDHIAFVETSFRERNTAATRANIARKRHLLLDLPKATQGRQRRRA